MLWLDMSSQTVSFKIVISRFDCPQKFSSMLGRERVLWSEFWKLDICRLLYA